MSGSGRDVELVVEGFQYDVVHAVLHHLFQHGLEPRHPVQGWRGA